MGTGSSDMFRNIVMSLWTVNRRIHTNSGLQKAAFLDKGEAVIIIH